MAIALATELWRDMVAWRCWCCRRWRPSVHATTKFHPIPTKFGYIVDDDVDIEAGFTGKWLNVDARDSGRKVPAAEDPASSADEAERLHLDFFDACSEYGDGGDASSGTDDVELSSPSIMCRKGPTTEADIAAHYRVPLAALQELAPEFWDCPPAELARFLARKSASGSPVKARALLRTHMNWRYKEYPRWPPNPEGIQMPLRFNGYTKTGQRILLFLPCSISLSFTPEQYTNSVVRYLDAQMPRESCSLITLLFDVRGHRSLGYNPKTVIRLWRHAAALVKAFQAYFPERMGQTIIYPAGDFEMRAARMFQSVVAKETQKRFVFLYDKLGADAVAPPKELLEYIELKEIWSENRKFFNGLIDVDAAG